MSEVVALRESPEQLVFEGVELERCVLIVRANERPWRVLQPGERLRVLVEGEVHVRVDTATRERRQLLIADWVEEA